MAEVLTFSSENFEIEVLNSELPVLVDFGAEWCPPCRALEPTIKAIADEFGGKAKVGKLDIDKNPDLSVQYGVSNIPQVFVFRNGEVVKKFVGVTPKSELSAAIISAFN